MSKAFRATLTRNGRILRFVVTAQPAEWRSATDMQCIFIAGNGVRIGSIAFPALADGYIWLQGSETHLDNRVDVVVCDSPFEAETKFKKYSAALQEFAREAAELARVGCRITINMLQPQTVIVTVTR